MNAEHLEELRSARQKYETALSSGLGIARYQTAYYNLLSHYGGELIDAVLAAGVEAGVAKQKAAELQEENDVLNTTIAQLDQELDALRAAAPKAKGK